MGLLSKEEAPQLTFIKEHSLDSSHSDATERTKKYG